MPRYPVVWRAPGELPNVGMLELAPSSLVLVGGERGAAQRVELAYSDVVGLGRADERLGRLPALRVEAHGLGTLLIAGVIGAALNSEILEELNAALASLF